ncbi:hypothetical protein INT47_002859 [Mucor saturninus]|uniref:Bis(5'-nucleosyl)-tetraphosphatase [asymmetrical] n=1 Tax=Mucor saturninus TaxID=64648 RepID=A0A8H7QPI6_9FUNG|nr:hypothetical protein INT47_002859 [Mucor saturninus]
MDKPSQTKLYAGLVIYRIQRNVEYLLLNDSFTNKKHWFCPKGQVIGNEDEIKCALRETFETTGLRPSELRIEEGFTIELKYLSGTKPKKVQYHLAQLLDNHVRLLPNAEGVHMQWYNQSACSEKVIFKSMQDVFKHAQTFIELKQQRRKHFDQPRMMGRPTLTETKSSTVEEIKLKSRPTAAPAVTTAPVVPVPAQQQSQQPQQQQQQQQAPSPLYKTRLCERYETEGVCPYGPKCNFAHGVLELRGKEQETTVPIPTTVPANQMMDAGNQLFKTRLCEKFIKEKFCQYGPKCHFGKEILFIYDYYFPHIRNAHS